MQENAGLPISVPFPTSSQRNKDALQEKMMVRIQTETCQLAPFRVGPFLSIPLIALLFAPKPCSLPRCVLDLPGFYSSLLAFPSLCTKFPGLSDLKVALFTLLSVFCRNLAELCRVQTLPDKAVST